MDISVLIRKTVKGEALSEPEKAALLALADRRQESGGDDAGTELEARINQLQDALAQTGAERDTANTELQSLKRKNSVGELARNAGFEDPGYLEYLLVQQQIDPADEHAALAAVAELRKSSPKLFCIPLKSGAGSTPSTEPRVPPADGSATGLAELLRHAPEIVG